MSRVYLLAADAGYDGYSVLGVFSSVDKAKEHAEHQIRETRKALIEGRKVLREQPHKTPYQIEILEMQDEDFANDRNPMPVWKQRGEEFFSESHSGELVIEPWEVL